MIEYGFLLYYNVYPRVSDWNNSPFIDKLWEDLSQKLEELGLCGGGAINNLFVSGIGNNECTDEMREFVGSWLRAYPGVTDVAIGPLVDSNFSPEFSHDEEGYFILSLKYSDGADLTWWKPNDRGYTKYIEDAGIYPPQLVEGNPRYYDNGVTTLAIPAPVVSVLRKTVVRANADTWKNFEQYMSKHIQQVVKGSDEEGKNL